MSRLDWFTGIEIAECPPFNGVKRTVARYAKKENWESRPRKGKGGGNEYHISSLPKETQRALKIRHTKRQQSEEQKTAQLNDSRLKGNLAAMGETADQKELELKKTLAFNKLGPKEQERVRARSEVLAAWELYIKDFEKIEPATRSFVEDFNHQQLDMPEFVTRYVPKVSRASLMRWKSAYALHGPAGLACHYKITKQSVIDSQPELLAFAEGMVAKMPHIKPTNLLRGMEGQFDLRDDITLPSRRALTAWLANWKVKNKRLFTAVANPDAFKNTYQSAAGDAAENIDRLNQLWEMDSSPADIMCTDGRFTIISCIDVYSRRAVFKVRKSSDSFGVVTTARKAILAWGLDGQGEQRIRVDNGSDYASHYFEKVADALDIKLVSTDPFAGEQKPFVERLFRTFAHGLVEMLPGFIGHNVAERKAIEAQFSFSDRLKRKAGSSKNVIEVTMSSEDLQAFCDDWINDWYMHEPHSSLDGKTPTDMVQNWLEPVRRIEDERALDLLLEPIPGQKGERTIQKKGIKLDGGWYVAPELGSRIGDRVMVRYDSSDIGRIYLFDLDGTFVCIAQNPAITGISREELARAMKGEQKKIQEQKAELKKKGKNINLGELIEKIFTRRRRENAERNQNVTQLPRRSLEHTTDYLAGASKALENADESGTTEPTPGMEKAMADFVTQSVNARQNDTKTEDPYDRFRRWYALEQRQQSGDTISEFEQHWKDGYETTAEWQGQKLMLDEFGKEMFGIQ